MQSAFDLSYQRLSPDHSRLFRLLPLNAGPDVSTESAARLADTDPDGTEDLLQDLARAHLIEPGRTWGRWRLHDLIRLYADQQGRTHADTDQRDTAYTRLLDHYQSTTEAAATHLQTLPGTTSPQFPDRRHALAWLDDERPNLIATATAPPPHGHTRTSTGLVFALGRFLSYRRFFDDWISVTTTALATCRGLGDLLREGMVLNNLGSALMGVRRFEEAIDAHTRAAAIFRDLGDRHGEGGALNNVGHALREMRRLEEAIDAYTRATAIHRDLGDRHDEGLALGSLGLALREVRRFEESIDTHTRATAIHRDLGDRHDEGMALNNLGLALREMRQFEESIDAYTRATAIFRDLGDRHAEGRALWAWAVAHNESRL
ncbi:tetratricopeptide repeat protein [Streptomyces sp. NPDC093510]|uniref:tetratricopeptide repeat protein n=1 Tax=Streptomyces sp. NPDC093510 TaxID=3155199 RepID=UPI00342FEDDE